jgi:Ecdysteroid kinase-like family
MSAPNDSPPSGPAVLHAAEEITGAWLGAILGCGPVRLLDTVAIGTGQMSQSHRATFTAGDEQRPRSVIVKLASQDPGSRATGIGLGAYAREIRFYDELATRIGGPLAKSHHAALDERDGCFTLVLEDIAPAHQGDQIAGCTVSEARLAMQALADVHAPVFDDPQLGSADWLNAPSPLNQALLGQLLPAFLERYGDSIAPEHRALAELFVTRADGWLSERSQPRGLAHADYRLDNLLFGEKGASRELTVLDWQTVGWSSPMLDASYFLGSGLTVQDRRAHERELVRDYHDALIGHGIEGFAWEQCWHEYRRMTFHGVVMAIAASMLVERTARGDRMFTTLFARHAQHAIDVDAAELLPAANAARAPALTPSPADEHSHPPTGEQLWNESWYFDAIDDDGQLGAYVRIGLYPNLGVCWYTAYVCAADRPAVAVVDFYAPLPGDDERLALATPQLRAEHVCEVPLQRFAVKLSGTGAAHADASGALRGEPGMPVAVELDLVWETKGTPYAYRMATRYEIPCRVSGGIRIGAEDLELRGTGQRDHSWGARDWWAMDWVWSAGELDDGTRFHGVQLRLPDLPTIGVGYVQSEAAGVSELERVDATETLSQDGLIESARIALQPAGIELEVAPIAFGPLRLQAPDGRLSLFLRAMCRLRADDGRTGLGWVEWNLNQR